MRGFFGPALVVWADAHGEGGACCTVNSSGSDSHPPVQEEGVGRSCHTDRYKVRVSGVTIRMCVCVGGEICFRGRFVDYILYI